MIETHCLLILGMMRCCTIPDVAMLRWIAYIKSLNPEVRHISGNDNAVADNEEVSEDYFASDHICRVSVMREFREDATRDQGFNKQ